MKQLDQGEMCYWLKLKMFLALTVAYPSLSSLFSFCVARSNQPFILFICASLWMINRNLLVGRVPKPDYCRYPDSLHVPVIFLFYTFPVPYWGIQSIITNGLTHLRRRTFHQKSYVETSRRLRLYMPLLVEDV